MPVDCVEVREALLLGRALSERASAHVGTCSVCSAIAERRPPGDDDGLDELFSGIQGKLARERGPRAFLRNRSTGTRLAAIGMWTLTLVGMIFATMPRTAFAPLPMGNVLFALLSFGTLFWVTLWIALRPIQAPPLGTRTLTAVLALGLLLPAALAFMNVPAWAQLEHLPVYSDSQATIGCFVIGAVVGGLVILSLRYVDRGGHGASGLGLLFATAGGLAANIALELHCAVTAPKHLLLGHATIGIAFALLSVGRWSPRLRPST